LRKRNASLVVCSGLDLLRPARRTLVHTRKPGWLSEVATNKPGTRGRLLQTAKPMVTAPLLRTLADSDLSVSPCPSLGLGGCYLDPFESSIQHLERI